jgi:hypothetical protein
MRWPRLIHTIYLFPSLSSQKYSPENDLLSYHILAWTNYSKLLQTVLATQVRIKKSDHEADSLFWPFFQPMKKILSRHA